MNADTKTLLKLFGADVRYEVPMFQRPYVWEQDKQWEPLWTDLVSACDQLLKEHSLRGDWAEAALAAPPHFFGAIVLDPIAVGAGGVDRRQVIDGQQRLTTLQLLIAAVFHELDGDHRFTREKRLLGKLLRNDPDLSSPGSELRFKVWPTKYDRPSFVNSMQGVADSSERLGQAHLFFRRAFRTWLNEALDQGDETAATHVAAMQTLLRTLVKIVVIDLDPNDNAQAIFEVLNARGTELLAIDLVKNSLFRTAQQRGEDVDALYKQEWHRFDTKPWRRKVRVGRLKRPRADQFFTYWLVLKTGQDIHSQQLFPTFQRLLKEHEGPIGELILDLTRYADVFDSFDGFDPFSPDGKFFERMRELDVTTFHPLLMLLYGLPESELPIEQRSETLDVIESWLARRAFCGWPTKQYNKIAPALISRVLEETGDARDIIIGSLRAFDGGTAAWPTDEEFITTLAEEPAYGRLRQSRVRMLLAGIEGHLRRGLSEQLSNLGNVHIEHVLPQQWQSNWPLEQTENPHLAAASRDEAKHMLGNLTLLTDKLNLKQSNQAWEDKRERLQRHSLLLLNKRLLESAPAAWDEEAIEARSRVLAAAAAKVWPGPQDRRWQSVGPVNLDGLDLGASGAVELSEWQPSDGDLAAQLWMKIPKLAKRILTELVAHPGVSYNWAEIVRTVAPKRPRRVVPSVQRIQHLAAELGRESPVRMDGKAGSAVLVVALPDAELFRPIAARVRESAPELPLRTPRPSPNMCFSLTAPDTWVRGVVSAMDESGSFEFQELRACWMLGKRRADEYLLLLENQRQQLHEQLGFELTWGSVPSPVEKEMA